jgi:hypothetical protein
VGAMRVVRAVCVAAAMLPIATASASAHSSPCLFRQPFFDRKSELWAAGPVADYWDAHGEGDHTYDDVVKCERLQPGRDAKGRPGWRHISCLVTQPESFSPPLRFG